MKMIDDKQMQNRINVTVTGFYGTGSSAVIDLLNEYDLAQITPYTDYKYEHVPFYVSGGLFDLCALLTRGNNPYSSDMVIHNFIKAMKRLNDYDYLWFGSYKKMFGDKFMTICNELVESLSIKRPGKNTNHIKKSRFSLIKATAQVLLRILKKRKAYRYGIHYVYDSKILYCAMPTEEEVYAAAKKFTRSYCELFNENPEKPVKIFDHLIWSNQIDAFSECFDSSFKNIVVCRDPRDVYLCDQYIWASDPHFPTDIDEFINEWKKTVVSKYNSEKAMMIYFEDLIYNYDATIKKIEDFIGVKMNHVHKGKFLQIEKSIENTQLFLVNDDWKKQADKIAEGLKDYLYKFPYERKPERKLMFE